MKNSGTEQGLEFFSDKQLSIFLNDLRQHFDFTIIDMPPMLKETSNIFLAPAVDRFYLIATAGKTRLSDLERCKDLAEAAKARIAGVILNQQHAPFWSRFFWGNFFF